MQGVNSEGVTPFNPMQPAPEPNLNPTNFGDVLGAGMRLENDMYAAWQMLNQPDFPTDESFQSYEHGPSSDLWLMNSESLSRAQSLEEFNFIEQKIRGEIADRETLSANGLFQGIMGAVLPGLLSPTSLIPLTTGAKGLKGMRDAFALAAGASTAQEAVLFTQQETRTGEEVAMGIAGGTVLGGLLGSAAVHLRGRDVSRAVDDMAGTPRVGAIQHDAPPSSFDALPTETKVPLHEADTYIPRREDYLNDVDEFLGEKGALDLPSVKSTDYPTPVLHSPKADPVVHAKVRATEPELFDSYDILLTRKQTLAKLVKEAQVKGSDLDLSAIKKDLAETNDLLKKQSVEIKKVYAKVAPEAEKAKKGYLAGRTNTEELPDTPTLSDRGVGAAARDTAVHGLRPGGNRLTTAVVNTLAGISGVGRTIRQKVSPVARQKMAQFHDGGFFLDTRPNPEQGFTHADNAGVTPANAGGTIAHRIDTHTPQLGQSLLELDDAYARYVLGDLKGTEELQSSTLADLRSGLSALPEGKLSRKEWDDVIFRAVNLGEASDDVNISKGIEAVKKFYTYFREIHDGAFEDVKLKFGDDMQPIIPDDARLGKDVKSYLNHVYDNEAIDSTGTEFQDELVKSGIRHLNKRFQKEHEKLLKALAKLDEEITMFNTPRKAATAQRKTMAARVKEIEATQDVIDGKKYLTELREQMKVAKAEPSEIRLALKEAKEGLGGAYNDLIFEWQGLLNKEKLWKTTDGKSPATRANRVKKLEEQRDGKFPEVIPLNKMTPEQLAKSDTLIAKLKEGMLDAFQTRWRGKGATGSEADFLGGKVDFADQALEEAKLLQHNIRGNKNRVAGMEILGGERGSQLSRTLDMPFEIKQKFLVRDLEDLMRIYSRHMAADLEIWRTTGSVNGARALADVKIDLGNAEQRLMHMKETKVRGKMVTVTPAMRSKMLAKFHGEEKLILDDFAVVIGRLRHTRAANMDTDSWSYRLGTLALNLNVMRSMGTVVTSSVSDVGRPVMMFGLTNTLRHGWGSYIKGLTGMADTHGIRQELKSFGVGWDPVLHNRAQAVFELLDVKPGRQSPVEKGAQFFANKIGQVALFDRWTAEMKFIAGSTAMGSVTDAMKLVLKGGTGKRVAWARTLLADGGLNDELINRIQKQLDLPDGSSTVNGMQLPNTGKWTDMEAVRAYRTMINKFTNDAIITPGPDRPSWMDASIAFRMLGQFRTFNMVATNRTMIRGLQQSDMAVLNGITVSLAMGAVSYYTWAMTVGGTAKAEMLKGDPQTWAYQAVSRSGLMALFAEPQRIGENVPALQGMAIFGGQTARTRRPTSLMAAIAGPSFDLGERMSKIIMGMDDPTLSTLHQARTMVAYQNVFYLRWLFNMVEEAGGELLNLPEQRSQ